MSLLRAASSAYCFLFGRPSMQRLNGAVLHMALRARGYGNFGSLKQTGEDRLLRLLSGAKLCVDVGANVGEYSRELLARTKATVIAFEPLPGAYASLCKLNQDRLITVNEGVGDRACELPLYFGSDDSVLASFSPEANRIGYVQNKNAVIVRMNTLDSFFERYKPGDIDLLKIDVEGLEYEVLSGARQTIATRRPKFVQVEYGLHQLFRQRSLFQLAQFLPSYRLCQLLPHGIVQRFADSPESNIYHYSNFVFVRPEIHI